MSMPRAVVACTNGDIFMKPSLRAASGAGIAMSIAVEAFARRCTR
jgi:hypothetical protein